MGYFSWLFCDKNNEENLRIGKKGYVLCPNGTVLEEPCYEGYGDFAGQDIFDLVAAWNRPFLAAHPEFLIPQPSGRAAVPIKSFDWYNAYANLALSRDEVVETARKAGSDILEYRWIGIAIACYNEQNAALPFPIKIAEARRERKYSELPTSKADPEQGMCAYHS